MTNNYKNQDTEPPSERPMCEMNLREEIDVKTVKSLVLVIFLWPVDISH
jgi:hypothetical protein